jgi:diguanylate cyclase
MQKRTSEEVIVLVLSLISVIGLLPFAIVRFSTGDWAVGLVDTAGVIGSSLTFAYVWRTHRTEIPGLCIAILSLSGMTANLFFLGPHDLYFLYPVTIAAFFLTPPTTALRLTGAALLACSIALFPVLSLFDFAKFFLSVLGCILFAYAFAQQRNRQRDQLLQLSTEDALTGAGNRRALQKKLDYLLATHRRSGEPMAAILLDLDNFKAINDAQGHATGDAVLRCVCDTIGSRIRLTDSLYRYGGDEFVVLASGTTAEAAHQLAEELRNLIAEALQRMAAPVTVSLGVAEHVLHETAEDWLARADAAMYQAKQRGKNLVATALPNAVLRRIA